MFGQPSAKSGCVIQVAEMLDDRDIQVMGCACAGWRDVLNRSIVRMCFTWAGHHTVPGYVSFLLWLPLSHNISTEIAPFPPCFSCVALQTGDHLWDTHEAGCQQCCAFWSTSTVAFEPQ